MLSCVYSSIAFYAVHQMINSESGRAAAAGRIWPVWKVPPPLDTQTFSQGCRARALALAQKRDRTALKR